MYNNSYSCLLLLKFIKKGYVNCIALHISIYMKKETHLVNTQGYLIDRRASKNSMNLKFNKMSGYIITYLKVIAQLELELEERDILIHEY